jgi:hypothetical protein
MYTPPPAGAMNGCRVTVIAGVQEMVVGGTVRVVSNSWLNASRSQGTSSSVTSGPPLSEESEGESLAVEATASAGGGAPSSASAGSAGSRRGASAGGGASAAKPMRLGSGCQIGATSIGGLKIHGRRLRERGLRPLGCSPNPFGGGSFRGPCVFLPR